MTFKQLRVELTKASVEATKVAAELAKTRIVGFVPIQSGSLRRSLRVEQEGGKVFITSGEGLPYAKKQYFENQRHGGRRGDYQVLRDTNAKKSEPRWFDPIIKGRGLRRDMADVYSKAVSREIE